MSLIKLHSNIKNPNQYVVDIGASTGVSTDPVYPFISNPKYKGLCIEGSNQKIGMLKCRTSFDICNQFVYPHNIIDIFQSYNVPIDLDILKIDIDGFDLDVIRTILSVYKPKIIIAEINEKLPPPILFETKFTSKYSWDESHFYGFSIKSGERLMNQHGYKIIEVFELNNILCINHELCEVLGEDKTNNVEHLYKTQYVEKNPLIELPWNQNVHYWLNITDPETLKREITNYFCNVNDRSKFDIKTKVLDVDFSIDIAK